MHPHGTDRLRPPDGERLTLASRISKGWVARVGKTLTSAEFPGTAILWEEQYFEVVEARELPQGGVEYVLEPWRDNNVMRVVQQYDEPAEAGRVEEHRAQLVRERNRKTANLAALFTGHLPAVVQNRMAENLGLLPYRITFVSVIGMYAVVVGCVLWIVSYVMRQDTPPIGLIVVTAYLGIETTARFFLVYTQNRPIGSALGLFGYIAWWLLTGRRGTSPFAVEKGFDVVITEAPDDVKMRDLLMMREPFLSLLPAELQERIAARFPSYDYRRYSTGIAIATLVAAVIGIASSLHRDAFVAFLVAVALAGEQVVRLMVLRRGPVGSVLGLLVRPFVRKLL
ncbi:MAG: hypothetical protein AABO58_21130 [Acidobacteriota bacterium]